MRELYLVRPATLLLTATAVAAVMLATARPAHANATITDPTGAYSVGIGPDGELFDDTTTPGVGFKRLSDSCDPLAPGTPRDSWGVSANLVGAYADYEFRGTSNLTSTESFTASSGTVNSNVLNGTLSVEQAFSFAAANVLQITTTVTNTSAIAQAVLFQRDIDWDVAPTPQDENTFGPAIPGGKPLVTGSPYLSSCAMGCNMTSDLGGGIMVSLGTLKAGAVDTFSYFYGISQTGQNVKGLDAQLAKAGAGYVISTQSSENGAYPNLGKNSAAIGAAVTPTGPVIDSTYSGFESPDLSGAVAGDPHFTTYGGLHYSFQGIGDFVLTRSTVAGDTFDVQIETSPWKGRAGTTTVSGVAADLCNNIASFDLNRSGAGESFLEVNGHASSLNLAHPELRLGGCQIDELSPKNYQLSWNTGESWM